MMVITLIVNLDVAWAESTDGVHAKRYIRPSVPDAYPLQASVYLLPPVLPDRAPSATEVRFVLKRIHFDGNTVFTSSELIALAEPYMGKSVSFTDLEDIRLAITRRYESAGYPNSGALLPSQHIEEGQVRFRIIEGRLDTVRIRGNGRLNPEYIRGRLLWGLTDRILDSKALSERFQLLLTDPLIERLQGKLRPGEEPGSGILDLEVTTANPFELNLGFDNHRSVSTGSHAGRLTGRLRNLTGWGDELSLALGHSRGAMGKSIAWTVPISPQDTRITIHHSQSRATIIEEPLNEIDIENFSRRWSIGFDYPLWRRTTGYCMLGAKFEHEFSRTWVLGKGESLSPGVEADGSARASVFRFIQDYALRGPTKSLAARSTVSIGIDAFDATIHKHQPDGRFVGWLGQARQAWNLKRDGQKRDDRIVLRADLQWSNDDLLPLEQFAVGGANSVRGYRENQLVRDWGYVASLQYNHSLLAPGDSHDLELVFFSDIGGARYLNERVPDSHLWSVGIGVRWDWNRLHVSVDWGHRLKAAPKPFEHDLQDEGIHFNLNFDLP
uniref:Hemolysin activation/secretion protein n=1 Tax=Candidatus Kentrum sp. TC TaxID=2126339 RepID=A0A450Z5P2_9GAMM|nr:MAG: Hemolysin activation/secretion protein [Candidatus Kentron sp. TC]VFK49114.1 MAG: Hemolysin activation/secretion protein [Candidatus Kentron sp. TC]